MSTIRMCEAALSASKITGVEYIELRAVRTDLIARMAVQTRGFDALLMATVAITAPPIGAFERDQDYRRLNAYRCETLRSSISLTVALSPCRYIPEVRP